MTNERKVIGNLGERLTYKYLRRREWMVLYKNYRKWGGEIDLIAQDPDTGEIVFIEVKTRKDVEWFDLDQTLSYRQIKHIKKIGKRFLYEQGIETANWRIDHVGILLSSTNEILRFEHFEAV
ncbi:hypothetical protein GF389_03820 [Candidatus Dojkabacteria bacterium]|nr:hypothetical protein [Candidatus Dojkabacteria bacterium]